MMDSFFAAADNLDSLLDELEESEEVSPTPAPAGRRDKMTTPVSLVETPSQPKDENLIADISEPSIAEGRKMNGSTVLPDEQYSAKTNFQPQDLDKPAFLLQLDSKGVDSNVRACSNGPDYVIPTADTLAANIMDNASQMLESSYQNNISAPSGETGTSHQPPLALHENSSLLKLPDTSTNSNTDFSQSDFQVINNPDYVEVPHTNSELLMELFGAVPTSQTTDYHEQSTSDTLLSPLNPFNDAYSQPEEENEPSAPYTSGVFSWDNAEIIPPTLNKFNPFYIDSQTQPAGVIDNLEQKSLNPENAKGETADLQKTYHSSDVDVPFIHKEGSAGLEGGDNASGSLLPEMPTDSSKKNLSSSNVDSIANFVGTENSGIRLEESSDEVVLTGSFPLNSCEVTPSSNSPILPEKQERSSVGFMRDVAVSQEDFERFWEEMEEAGVREETAPNKPAEFYRRQDSLEIISPVSSSQLLLQDSRKDVGDAINNATESIIASQRDVTVVEPLPASITEDAVIVSSIPVDALISENEFEQFLSSEINAATTEVCVTPATPNPSVIETAPVAVPVATNLPPMIHDGSPTFPLLARTPQNTQTPPAQPQQENQQGTESNRLLLNIPVAPGREPEATELNLGYTATPPPPYTQEMHANYEMSLSPTQQTISSDQLALEQTQHQNAEAHLQSGNSEDDFSLLPSAILESITRPGETKPTWVPDQDAPQCSNCAVKFTFTRRRHHCRACGRVFCAVCCNERSQLKYIDYKEARVCLMCSLAIKQADALAVMSQRTAQSRPKNVAPRQLNAEVPQDVEATQVVPPAQDVQQPSAEQPVETPVPAEQSQNSEQNDGTSANLMTEEDTEVAGAMARTPNGKSVRFSDGTRPKHPDEIPTTPPPPTRVNRMRKKHTQPKVPNSVEPSGLPPVIIAHGENGAYAAQEHPDPNVVMNLLESGDQNPQSFVLNPNLIVHVKFVTHAGHQCWCYWSEGMDSVGQREVVLLLEREGLGDRQISRDAFLFYSCIFDRARKGKIFNTTDFMPRTMLGVEDSEDVFGLVQNTGFLFVQATSQALDGLMCLKKKVMQFSDQHAYAENTNLPIISMLFAILVQKNEASWATLFPMRLMLRLGKETKQYPCPLFSIRRREPVYHEVGHTILAILCDFRNFKYRVVSVPGLRVVVTSSGSVSVQIPCNRFADTVRIMNSSNESVLAIGTGTFGPKILPSGELVTPSDGPCDSHLVCVQDQQNSNYHTEIMTMKGTKTVNTGAAFVIFNGSLKSDGSHFAKCAIVEDGIMIQLLPEKMEELRASLKSMEDFRVEMGSNLQGPSEPSTESGSSSVDPPSLEVKWVEDDTAFNIGMFSPIDGTPFEGVVGFNVQGRSEQKARKHTLRWNQVFFLASTSNPLDISRLAEQVANGCFLALTPVLHELVKHRQHKVAIRVTIHPENVGYVAGSRLHDLPPACMSALDEHLIQTIHNAASNVAVQQEAVVLELLFSILLSRPAYRTV